MIGAERPAIFPLRVADPVAAADRDPAIFADRMPLLHEGLPEPRHDDRRFRFELPVRHIVIGQRAVKRVLPRNEIDRDVVVPPRRIGVVVAAVISRPIRIPRALVIRHRIIRGRHFADPENGRDDVGLPRIAGGRKARGRRDENLRLDFEERLGAQFHRVFREIRAAFVRRLRRGNRRGRREASSERHQKYCSFRQHLRFFALVKSTAQASPFHPFLAQSIPETLSRDSIRYPGGKIRHSLPDNPSYNASLDFPSG